MLNYGRILVDGKIFNIETEKGRKYLKKSSKIGNKKAIFLYGMELLKEDESNKKDAIRFIKESDDNGSKKAMYQYAIMLIKGDIVEKNTKKTALYLKRSANLGYNILIALLWIIIVDRLWCYTKQRRSN